VKVGDVGTVRIAGDLRGGLANGNGGVVFTDGNMGRVTIGGSLIGGAGQFSGAIATLGGNIGTVQIRGSLRGDGDYSGVVSAQNNIGRISVAGSLIGAGRSGTIFAKRAIGSISVRGSIIGSSSLALFLCAGGPATPTGTAAVAIGSLRVGGSVEFADIRAGFDGGLNPTNADAQIGSVVVGGDWIASNLSAGADRGGDAKYGTFDDVKITGGTDVPGVVSKITSIVIGGQALGTPGGSDHFGFVAQQIGSIKVGGTAQPLTPGPDDDVLDLGATGDLTIREVGL
jgi:hypothetical protein